MATVTKPMALDETLQATNGKIDTLNTKLQGIADAIVSGVGSNPNLLINPWFTVNQRGVTSATLPDTNTYLMDRWSAARISYSLTSSGFSFAWNGVNSSDGHLIYKKEVDTDWIDQIFTLSAIIDGNIVAKTFTMTAAQQRLDISSNLWFLVQGNKNNADTIIWFKTNTTTAHVIKAIKLEKGSVSTLHLDTAPDYTTELLKCRRYFRRIKEENNATLALFLGMIDNATTARFMIQNPVPMRIRPTLNYSGTLIIADGTNSYTASAVTIPASSTGEFVRLDVTSSGMTAGSVCRLNISSGSYIDFSSEL